VEVHCDEGVATHIGPAPCVVTREGRDEASAGERIGQPLSLENYINRDADAGTHRGRQHGQVRQRERLPARRGQRPWHVRTLLGREPGGLARDRLWQHSGPHREGEEP